MSVKYNNPGNIRPGQGYAGETGEFYYDKNGEPYVIFDSPELGLRAMFVDLRSKIKEFDGDIKSIVNKYAPPQDDNPTSSYVDFVISSLGKDKVTESDLSKIVSSFVKFENKPDVAKKYLKKDLLDTASKLSAVSMPQSYRLEDALSEIKTDVKNTKTDAGLNVSDTASEELPNILNVQEELGDSADAVQSIAKSKPDILDAQEALTDSADAPQGINQSAPNILNAQETLTDSADVVQQEPVETSSILDVQEELVDSASVAPNQTAPTVAPISSPARKPRQYSDDNFREDFLEVNTSKIQGYVPKEDLYNEDYFGFTDDSAQIWSAAMRANNPIYSVSNFIVDQFIDKKQDDPSYDPASDKRISKDELWNYIDSGSYDETTRIMKRIQEQREDMAVLSMSQSGVAEFTSSMLTPTTIAPLAPLRFMKSSSALTRFMGAGAFNAAVMAPEELIMAEQNVNRDLSHAALTIAAAGLIGGGLNAAVGSRYVSRTVVGDDLDEFGEPVYRSAGASVSPEKAREAQWAMMEGDAFVETGVGIEKLGWNPVNRLIKSLSPVARSLAPEMVDMGGMMQKKVKDGVEMAQSVETTFRTKYLSGLLSSMRAGQEAYLSYRGVTAKGGDVRKSFQTLGFRVKDAATRQTDFLSEYQFRERVSRAMRRNDIDDIGDAASPFVSQAAQAYRKQLDLLAKNGTEVGLFERQLRSQIIAARESGNAALVVKLEKALKDLQEKGLLVNTAETYVPKVARIDKIMANEALFLRKVSEWAMANKGMSSNAAQKFAKESMDSYTNARPYLSPEDPEIFEFIVKPSGIKARTSEIPDEVIEEFLENDIEVLIRHQTKTMGMDIELTRKFGDISMSGVLDDITQEYNTLMGKVFEKIDNIVTGQSISVKVHRGSGGKGKVSFEESALGDGLYFATNAKTASRFGKQVDEVDINLKNPLKITSDDELMALFRQAGLNADELQAAKKAYDDFMSAMAEKRKNLGTGKSLAENKKLTDEWFAEFDSGYNKVAGNYSSLRRSYMKQLRQWAESNGHDSISINFGLDDFDQVTKGKLTPLKIMDEYSNIAGKGGRHQILEETFSHDQIVVFNKKFDDYGSVGATRNQADIVKLEKAMEADLRDVRGLRDRLRGTYGASKDPHAMSSRFVRNLKSFNVIVGMGGAMVSSIPDIARTVMVEGITNTYEYGIKNLFKSNQSIVKKMTDDELKMAAVSADVLLGLRSSAFSDIGDIFGARFGFERGMNSTASMMFMLNGLNIWNQVLKEFAGNVTALRMTKAIMTDWGKLSKSDKEKLLKNGISPSDHAQMQQLVKKHGVKEDGIWMPNTSSWGNDIQIRKFRNALNQNVDRIIVTPGAGDRALWTSTELGSLMTQFKSYGQGATVRLLASGLQERDGAFWQGAFMLIGLASIVNEFKRAQYGIDSKETFDEKLLNAIDRSGVGGFFTDVNNAVEKLTNNKIGMRPALTDAPQYKLPDAAKAGAVLGAGITNLMTAGDVFSDVVTGSADEKTLRNARFITPFSTLPPLDPILDGVFGE